MKNTLLILMSFILHFGLVGQVGTGLENSLGITEGNLRNGSGLSPINTKSYKMYVGSSLLYENNKRGYIKFKKGFISEEYMLNIDLLSNNLNVYKKSDVSIPLINIDTIFLYEDLDIEKFIPFIIDDQELFGKVIFKGDFDIIKAYKVKLQKPNYNVALDQGSSLPKIIKSEEYYLFLYGEYIKLPSKSKTLKKINQLDKRLKIFANDNSTSLSSDEEIVAFFTDYFKSIN